MDYNIQEEAQQLMPAMHEVAARRSKWAHLTEGIKDDYRRRVTEVLMDNQERALLRKAQTSPLFEDTVTTQNVSAFTTFSLPLIRRVYPNLIAQELVTVQPMSQPTGKAFYFDIQYSGGNTNAYVPTSGNTDPSKRVDVPGNFSTTYASAGEGQQLPELNLRISSADISAELRKLKAKWTMESQQDLAAYFGLDAEGELMTALADEIARETDRTIIEDLFNFAGAGNVNWVSTQPTSGPWSLQNPKEYARTLYESICDANNLIVKKRYRNATWIVAGPDACTRMEKMNEFRLFPGTDPGMQIVNGPHLFGTISGRWTVYKDPWLGQAGNTDLGKQILLGFRGTSPLDAGYVYAPYIPLLTTAPWTDPNTLTTVRGMITRFAKKGLIPECYATVTIL